jgi:GntR family transcriptional regulator
MEDQLTITPSDTLVKKATRQLRRFLQENYEDGGKIPGEIELAGRMKINRGTVRQALNTLEQEGLLVRRRGSGSFVNRHVLDAKMRIESFFTFQDYLPQIGSEVTQELESVEYDTAGGEVAGQLDIPDDSQVLVIKKWFLLDGDPVIYVTDSIAADLIQEPYSGFDFENESAFTFIEKYCYAHLDFALTSIVPRLAGNRLAEMFNMKSWQPIIELRGTYFPQGGTRPLLYGIGCYRPDVIQFQVLRRQQ